MNEPRPSVARLLNLIATAIFATIIAVVLAIILVTWWERASGDFWTRLLSDVDDLPVILGSFCFGTLIGSPLLLRFGRVSTLCQAALLATAIVGLSVFLLATDRLRMVERFIEHILPPGAGSDLPTFLLISFAQVVNTATVCLLYRFGSRYFRRASLPENPDPDAPAISPRPRPLSTRAEFGTFALILAGILLFIGGLDLAIRELLVRQIPPAIWEVLQNPKELTLLAIAPARAPKGSKDFHSRKILQEVPVTTARERAAIITCLKRSIRHWWKRQRGASASTYGLRATGGAATVDFLISLGNEDIIIFEDGVRTLRVEMHGSSTEFDAILQAALVSPP